ncbi:AGAP003585-PA-like protein [Anopheles sinensis]|uniref:AGAP003585-PA-like protein n=1 Tax=Anopheles sinensis TaxID=74873 RepID=A0A084VH93_ANOSI|nr:AGAP003585-PA-like protein [Anopheles sinensis]
MNVVQSNISTTIRSFNISDDIRIEVKKFRTNASIDEVDIEEDEDDISVIQKIHKTFADPHSTTYDSATLKSIIARLDDIEKKLENIVHLNQQAEALSAAISQQQSLANLPSSSSGVVVGSTGDDGLELKLELDSDSELIGEFIEQDELKLVEFPINRIEELKELEESIMSDQESFVSFVNFISATVQKHNRNLELVLKDFISESLINELGYSTTKESMLSFYIFNQLLYDIWKNEYSTINDYNNKLKNIVTKTQNRMRSNKNKK